ncbi:uncharacterized protein LKV04_002691 [Tautogolabrus adspersus]
MQTAEKKKTWDSSRFRPENLTHWKRSHPVMFPHLQTDHWSKMKTKVPVYLASLPAALLKDRVYDSQEGALYHLLPPLTWAENAVNNRVTCMVQRAGMHQNAPSTSPRNMPQYKNVYNDHARRNFCYWLIEKKGSTCKGYSFGAYKTCLGLPKV